MKKHCKWRALLASGVIVAMVTSTCFLAGASTEEQTEKTLVAPTVEAITTFSEYMGNNKKNDPKQVAILFLKAIYSDYRTVVDDNEFNKIIDVAVSPQNSEFKQMLKDKKYIYEQRLSLYEMKENMTKNELETPKIVSQSEDEVTILVRGTHEYLAEYPKTGQMDEIESGVGVMYAILLKKENGEWKVSNVVSGDIVSEFMFGVKDAETDKELIDRLKTQKENTYNINEILGMIKESGELSINDRKDEAKQKSKIAPDATVKSGGNVAFSGFQRLAMNAYQQAWWNGRNPAYNDYSGPNEGDCTNYASQVIRASGCNYGEGHLRVVSIYGFLDQCCCFENFPYSK